MYKKSLYRQQTRKNICVDNQTYKKLLLFKKALVIQNQISPFTNKVISQHDTVRWLLENCPSPVEKAFKKQALEKYIQEYRI
jgi:hypothetical protein|tara:strand:- start:198 stop:443 length:246 start_codon:yes stop_codon:yes gene_type:complete